MSILIILEIEIDIKTTKLNISEDKIIIHYTVLDSNEDYEYEIEMSEINEYKNSTI